jgi:hypothetical protein
LFGPLIVKYPRLCKAYFESLARLPEDSRVSLLNEYGPSKETSEQEDKNFLSWELCFVMNRLPVESHLTSYLTKGVAICACQSIQKDHTPIDNAHLAILIGCIKNELSQSISKRDKEDQMVSWQAIFETISHSLILSLASSSSCGRAWILLNSFLRLCGPSILENV